MKHSSLLTPLALVGASLLLFLVGGCRSDDPNLSGDAQTRPTTKPESRPASRPAGDPVGAPGPAQPAPAHLAHLERAYFASGCFWCVEAIFESVRGVEEAVSGYAGGPEANPTYRTLKTTGHTEAVEVFYDPAVVSFETLLTVYYASHDPTTFGQNPDFGSQYRSMIFYRNGEEKRLAEAKKAAVAASGAYDDPVVTEIAPMQRFWRAEEYHQNYERLNPNERYVRNVSIPRLNRFKAKLPELLKDH